MTSWASCTPPTEDNYTRDNCLVDSPMLVKAANVSEYMTSIALCVNQSAFWAVAPQGACGRVSVRTSEADDQFSKYLLVFRMRCFEYCWTPAWPALTTWDCLQTHDFYLFFFKGVNLFTGEPKVLFSHLRPHHFGSGVQTTQMCHSLQPRQHPLQKFFFRLRQGHMSSFTCIIGKKKKKKPWEVWYPTRVK